MTGFKPVYIVDGVRTPFLKARAEMGPFSAADLAVNAGRALLTKQSFLPEEIDEVIVGCVMPREDEANIARIIALRLGCGKATPAWTVQRNCASGLQALDSALKDIQLGRSDLVLAGGTEAMSHAPLIFRKQMVNWLGALRTQRSVMGKAKTLAAFRPYYLAPIIALLKGLTDPLYNINMGQTAENVAFRFGITREQMDTFALRSHEKAMQARESDYLSEIAALFDSRGRLYDHDDGVRADSSLEKLSKLKPFFDRRFGQVTAANSSQVTDGSAMLLLASEAAVKQHQLPVIARIVDVEWAALNPEVMGLGPVMAATPLLQRHGFGLDDIDYWEINEAFAAQVLGCQAAWLDLDFCRQELNLPSVFGEIDPTRLNIDGGAIAIGHPIGASGARIALHLSDILQRKQAKRGVAALCIGGGQGGAMLIERV